MKLFRKRKFGSCAGLVSFFYYNIATLSVLVNVLWRNRTNRIYRNEREGERFGARKSKV